MNTSGFNCIEALLINNYKHHGSMVSYGMPMVFLSYVYCIPMVCLRYADSMSVVCLWYVYGVLRIVSTRSADSVNIWVGTLGTKEKKTSNKVMTTIRTLRHVVHYIYNCILTIYVLFLETFNSLNLVQLLDFLRNP